MTKEQIFSAWVPDASLWSRWAKPVTFAHMDLSRTPIPLPEMAVNVDWAPAPVEKVALILDLLGVESVTLASALAERGYQPVPLFNALPLPTEPPADDAAYTNVAAVDIYPIIDALRLRAERLQELSTPADAPPAFLLDARRQGDKQSVNTIDFDNRSVSFSTDFPSANFLVAQRIHRALLIQKDRLDPQADLAHTLRRWQEGGIRLERIQLKPLTAPEAFEVARPAWYGAMFQRILFSLGLRRAWGGGFGAWLQDSAGGG
jgi:hypothetical protein